MKSKIISYWMFFVVLFFAFSCTEEGINPLDEDILDSINANIDSINISVDSSNVTSTDSSCIKGEGINVTKTLSLDAFKSIDLAILGTVTISQGTTQEVKVTGNPNIIDSLTTGVSDESWKISLNSGCYQYTDLSIEITVPNMTAINLSGSGKIQVNDFRNQQDLSLNVSGSGDITLNGFEGITELPITISGSGSVVGSKEITTLQNLNVTVSGSGKYLAYPIIGQVVTVNLSGSGNIETTVMDILNANISGSGNISYKGNPTINQNITGSGKLVDAN